MSQESAKDSENHSTHDLIIDLDRAQQATVQEVGTLLHEKQLKTLEQRVREIVNRVHTFTQNLVQGERGGSNASGYTRYHEVITVHGKRGSGKTTFLLSALNLLDNQGKSGAGNANTKDNADLTDKLCVLGIMDPTLFGLHEHLLLTVLSKITQKVRFYKAHCSAPLCDAKSGCDMEQWEKQLRCLSKGLKTVGETREDLSAPPVSEVVKWEDAAFLMEQGMDNARQSVDLERQFHNFLHESLKLLGKDAFVLALDDIDTRPAIGWHVLEVLRRYFTSPQLVVILSGDLDLFKRIIEKKQLDFFGLSFSSGARVREEFKSQVDGLTEQYLLKILRAPSRMNLGSFQVALQQWERANPERTVRVRKGGTELPLDAVLLVLYHKILRCYTGSEQRLFREALFSNPTRTVVQVLDGLMDLQGDDLVSRLREVFLVSLQNLGFEQPFDLPQDLSSPRGISVLMRQLFVHNAVAQGLELLPSRSQQDENNGLLALQAEMSQAMQNNPAVLLAYTFKACLLREVLARQDFAGDDKAYAVIATYLALEEDELPSATAARISALHWGDPLTSGPLCYRGMVRLYGASIRKNAPAAVQAMYGTTVEELEDGAELYPEPLEVFCEGARQCNFPSTAKSLRRWVNTPETLRDTILSWQRDLTNVGIVEITKGNSKFRTFSIFSLLAVMVDVLACAQEDIASLLTKYDDILNVATYGGKSTAVRTPQEDTEEDTDDAEINDESSEELPPNELNARELFIAALVGWAEESRKDLQRTSLPATLCARVMTRFFRALERMDDEFSAKEIFVGTYIHRCLVAFFNSVLVEELLLIGVGFSDGKPRVSLNAPVKVDKLFVANLEATYRHYRYTKKNVLSIIPPKCALFRTVASFPLWDLYLDPRIDLRSKIIENINRPTPASFQDYNSNPPAYQTVFYRTPNVRFDNLFHVLNSLAIPKPAIKGANARSAAKVDAHKQLLTGNLLTAEGVRLGLSLENEQVDCEKIIDDLFKSYPAMVRSYKRINTSDKNYKILLGIYYKKTINIYFTSGVETKRIRSPELRDTFWEKLQKHPKWH